MMLGYMVFWSLIMMVAVGVTRLKTIRQYLLMTVVTALILMIAYALANELAAYVGLDITFVSPLVYPEQYLRQGLFGWLVLIVLPCGWLAPIIGVNTAQREFSLR